jgi:competence protein ComEA
VPEIPAASEDPSADLPAPAGWRERLELLTDTPLGPARIATGAVGAVVAAVVVVLVLRGPPPPPELALPLAGGPDDPAATTTSTAPAPAEVLVHAAGAVRVPGVYRLDAAARVADLVEAAGGPLEDGDLDRLNLAAPLTDGERVYVPRVGEVGAEAAVAGAVADESSRLVDVNTAGAEQLESLPGVGPATAQAILDERERRGSFATVDDLLDVRGIGPAKLEALRDRVTV